MIRTIRSDDAAGVAAILQDAILDGGHTTIERLVEDVNEPHFIGLAEEGTTGIVGAIIGQVVADAAEIHEIAVAQAHRRSGHGCTLVQAFMAEVVRRGATTCFLEVRSANIAAVSLYSSLGFEACGERKGYYRDGANALVMRHSLEREA